MRGVMHINSITYKSLHCHNRSILASRAHPRHFAQCRRVFSPVRNGGRKSLRAESKTARLQAVGTTQILDPVDSKLSISNVAQVQEMRSLGDAHEELCKTASAKANAKPTRTFVLSVIAGFLIGLGGILMTSVGVTLPPGGVQRILSGLVGLPLALLFVLTTGTELVTGNMMTFPLAMYNKRIGGKAVLSNWAISTVGNLIGCTIMGFAVSSMVCDLVANPMFAAAAQKIAAIKFETPLRILFFRGIFANWMVTMAVFLATSARSLPGKVVGIILPISAFVAIGFEHSVANMYFIPAGVAAGYPFDLARAAASLTAVFLGNAIGGGICMAGTLHYSANK